MRVAVQISCSGHSKTCLTSLPTLIESPPIGGYSNCLIDLAEVAFIHERSQQLPSMRCQIHRKLRFFRRHV